MLFFSPAIFSADMFVNLWAKTERNFYLNIPLYTNIPSYCSYWGETAYLFCYISRSCHWQALQKIVGGRAAFLLKLQAIRIIQRFLHFSRKWIIFMANFEDILKRASFCETIYRLPKTVSWRCS